MKKWDKSFSVRNFFIRAAVSFSYHRAVVGKVQAFKMGKNRSESCSSKLQYIPFHYFFLSGALSTRITPEHIRKRKEHISTCEKLYQLVMLLSNLYADIQIKITSYAILLCCLHGIFAIFFTIDVKIIRSIDHVRIVLQLT